MVKGLGELWIANHLFMLGVAYQYEAIMSMRRGIRIIGNTSPIFIFQIAVFIWSTGG